MKGVTEGATLVNNAPEYDKVYPTIRHEMIDRGLYMNRHYSQPVCTPSRKQILSGRTVYNQNNGDWGPLRPRYSLVSDKLKQAGYRTHMVGKWHVGSTSRRNWPLNRGFDTSLGFHSAGIGDFYTWEASLTDDQDDSVSGSTVYDLFVNDEMPNCIVNQPDCDWPGTPYIINGSQFSISNKQRTYETLYAEYKNTSLLQSLETLSEEGERAGNVIKTVEDETIKRIEQNDGTPWFIFVSTPAMRTSGIAKHSIRQRVFSAMETKIDNCDHYSEMYQPFDNETSMRELKRNVLKYGGDWSEVNRLVNENFCQPFDKNQRFGTHSYASTVDDLLNRSLKSLYETNQYENTLIVYTADNGGYQPFNAANWPLRGGKSSYLEGGMRIHTAISGGYLPITLRRKVSNALTSNVDWWPTLSWIAGLDPYYDPKEDFSEYSSEMHRPNAVDGINMVHSWNKLARDGQSSDEYVNGMYRYVYHYGGEVRDDNEEHVDKANIYHYASSTQLVKIYQDHKANCGSALNIPVEAACTESMIRHRVYPCRLSNCSVNPSETVCSRTDPCIYDMVKDPYEKNSIVVDSNITYMRSHENYTSNAAPRPHKVSYWFGKQELPILNSELYYHGVLETSEKVQIPGSRKNFYLDKNYWGYTFDRYASPDSLSGFPHSRGLNTVDIDFPNDQIRSHRYGIIDRCTKNDTRIGWVAHMGANCYTNSEVIDLDPNTSNDYIRTTLNECKSSCERGTTCEFIIVDAPSSDGLAKCWHRHSRNDFLNCGDNTGYNTHVLEYEEYVWDMKSTFCDVPQFTTHWSIYANYFDGELLNTYPQVTSDDIKTTCVDPCGIDPVCHSVTVNEDTNNLYNCQSWRIQESNVSESVHVYHGSSFGLFYKNPFTFIKKEFM